MRIVAAVPVLLFVAACSSAPAAGPATSVPSTTTSTSAPKATIGVTLRYHSKPYDRGGIARQNNDAGSPCGTSSFSKSTDRLAFMDPGSDVLLKDQKGTILAKTALSVGATSNAQENNEFDCTWSLQFTQVDDATFYQLALGSHELGTFSRDDLKAAGGTVAIVLS